MKRIPVFIILAALTLSSRGLSGQSPPKESRPHQKSIAITFDNLPAEPTYSAFERRQINQLLLSSLKKNGVKAAGFVVGDYLNKDWELIVKWLDDGHIIGSLPFSGQRIDDVPLTFFFDDIIKGRDVLENLFDSYAQTGRYFRLPFLYAGSNRSNREELFALLRKERLILVDASIITEDFVYNLSLEKLGNTQDTVRLFALRDQYIDHILRSLSRAEELAQKLLERQPRQILKLQANKINAYFIDDILRAIKASGYKFISLPEALKDQLYRRRDACFDDNRPLSLLERLLLSDPDLLPAEEE
ncbi:MAG: polysaccharide deacetylase family protein [Candidatus Zixiibacteriota bacterium]